MNHIASIYYFSQEELITYYNKLSKSEQRKLISQLVLHQLYDRLEMLADES